MLRVLRPAPPPPTRKKSPLERSSGCTHIRMTRLWDKYGAYKCSICDKHPSLGWLYRCTQDSNGFLPESDFLDVTHRDKKKIHMDPSLHNLSPSVIKAIGRGEYTDDQVNLLVRQKENVRLSIIGQETRPTTATTNSSVDTNNSSNLPQSTTFSSTTSANSSLDEELRAAYDWAELQKVWLSEPAHPPGQRPAIEIEREEALQAIDPPDVTPCSFKICANCRPTYRERATQSIAAVLNNPVWPPNWELDNRPVSDGRLLSRISLPKFTTRFYAQSTRSEIDTNSSVSSAELIPSDEKEEDLAMEEAVDHSFRRRSGFRETVRNALKRALPEQQPLHEPTKGTSVNGSVEESPSPFSRSMLFLRRKSKPAADFTEPRSSVVGNRSLQDSLMLMLASNTPLPQGPRTPQISNHSRGPSDLFTITETSSTPDEIIYQI